MLMGACQNDYTHDPQGLPVGQERHSGYGTWNIY